MRVAPPRRSPPHAPPRYGLLYDKHGISSRLVYTWRSKYYDGDDRGTLCLQPLTDPTRANDVTYVPTFQLRRTERTSRLNSVAPSGRLDASISYDVNENIRIDLGTTNLRRASLPVEPVSL